MRHERLFILCVLVACLVGVTGCRARKPLRPVRIGIQNNVFPALVLVAKGAGYFEDEGLDVTIVNYPSGKLALKAAFAGDVDLATVADMPVMVNSFTRDDYRVICSLGYTDNGAWIIARRDRGISTPADLVGKTIATQEGSAVHFFLASFLLHHRIPANAVDIEFMPGVDLPGALIDGSIDAFSMRNPFIEQARQALGDNAIEIWEPHAYRMFFLLAGRRDVLEQDASLGRDMVAALVKAEAFAIDKPAQAQKIVAEQLGAGREAEVAGDWEKYTFTIALGQDMLRGIEEQARWAIELGRTPTQELPNLLSIIDSTAVKAVRPESFTIIE